MSKRHQSQKANKLKARQNFMNHKIKAMTKYPIGLWLTIKAMTKNEFDAFEKEYKNQENLALEKVKEILSLGDLMGKIFASQSEWDDEDYVFYQVIKSNHDPIEIEMVALKSSYDSESKTFQFMKNEFHEIPYYHRLNDDNGSQWLLDVLSKKPFHIDDGTLIMIDSDSQFTIPQ